MFRYWACLTTNPCFPTVRGTEKHWHVDYYVAKLCEWLWEAFKEVQMQSTSEAERQKQYYDRKANAILLEMGQSQANAYKRKRKVKDWWEEEPYKVEFHVTDGIPSYLMKNWHESSTETDFSHHPMRGIPLCMVVWARWAWHATSTLEEPAPGRSETEKAPQGLPLAH